MALSLEQQTLLEYPVQSKIFLQGMAGTGKTTGGAHWLKKLLQSGVPAHEILIFVPQRALAQPYLDFLREEETLHHNLINTITLGGLARRMVDLYWPLVSPEIGVAKPNQPPHFLTLETAQYYMAHIVRPLIDEAGYFESLTIHRNRIYSQILDNLNKAAVVGFPHTEIGDRLKDAWVGDTEQHHIYDDVQNCVNQFRAFCLENNLLDFSLQVETFVKHLWHSGLSQNYLQNAYRHLIVDNIEEDTPISHDLLREWIPAVDSALIIFDEGAGYRFFLGADRTSALSLKQAFKTTVKFQQNHVNSPEIKHLKFGLQNTLARLQGKSEPSPEPDFEQIKSAIVSPEKSPKYFPAMIAWVSTQIAALMDEGVNPGQIVVLAPFMPDVLQFSLSNQLDGLGIPNQSHRPSRSLRDEPATQTLLTLVTVAFPEWGMLPNRINLSYALMQVIDGLDLVRAQLLTEQVYQPGRKDAVLSPFESVPADLRDRITYRAGERYDRLRTWLETAKSGDTPPLDFFLNRLFGEVLSQPGFGFHQDLNSGNTIANLVESIQKFRWAVDNQSSSETFSIYQEYVQMVREGVIAAQYIRPLDPPSQAAVFIAPAYTFLISNQSVDYQFWLDIGSPSWYQRLDQPLTQPYVLSRQWKPGQVWDTDDEVAAAHDTLSRLTVGLLNRCRKRVFIGLSELDVRGYENRGLLIRILQQVMQTSQRKTK